MNNVIKHLFILLFFSLFFSCHNEVGHIVNVNRDKYENKCRFVEVGKKEFLLDSETSFRTGYLQFIDSDTANMLQFVNEHNNSIYFYDYDSLSYIRKIQFDKEGANGVHKIQGFLYLNEDSIFVYSYSIQTLFLTDSKSIVKEKYKLSEPNMNDYSLMCSAPFIDTSSPIRKSGDVIVSMGFLPVEYIPEETETNRPVACFCRLSDKHVWHGINYPKHYYKYNWAGGFTYRQPYFDIDEDENIIVSFSADHNIYKYSPSDITSSTYYAGSNDVFEIKSFPFPKKSINPINHEVEKEWYMSNPSYRNILYDKYNKLYYRFVTFPLKNYEKGVPYLKKPFGVIVLDRHLNYIGEINLYKEFQLKDGENWQYTNSFISPEGLNINVNTNDEDKMKFYIFKFIVS